MPADTTNGVKQSFGVEMIVPRFTINRRLAYRFAFAMATVAASARRFKFQQARVPIYENFGFRYTRDGRALVFEYAIHFTHEREWHPDDIQIIDALNDLRFGKWTNPDVAPDSPVMLMDDAYDAFDIESKVIDVLREHVPGLEDLE